MQLLHRWDKYQWEHYLNKIKPNYIFRMTHLLFFKIEWNAMEFNRIALDWMKLNWMNIFRGTPSPRMNYWNNWEAYSQLNRKYCSKQPAQQNSFVITVYYSCFSVFGNYIWRPMYDDGLRVCLNIFHLCKAVPNIHLYTSWCIDYTSSYMNSYILRHLKSRFPNEIKTEIRYLKICCYLNFTSQKYDNPLW